LYFTAGYNHQMDGLFGDILPAPEPGTKALLLAAIGSTGALHRFRRGKHIV
jgi:hypothetical protein